MQIKDIWQCCYGHDNGWGVLYNTINDDRIMKNCVEMLNRNCSVSNEQLLKNPRLSVRGVYCDELAVYVYRIQYGLVDSQNRHTSFSHAFVFPWNEQTISDPNVFLNIKDDYFRNSVEEVRSIQDHELTEDSYQLTSVLSELNIDTDDYRTLIDSVFYRLSSETERNTVYIQCDADRIQMSKILYCIFTGLPFHLRKRMSVMSCDTGNWSDAAFLFSENALGEYMHLDPGDGRNNNVLPLSQQGEMDEKDYIKEPAKILQIGMMNGVSPEHELREYFSNLDRALMSVFGINDINDENLNIAYKIANDVDYSTAGVNIDPVMELVNALSSGIECNDLFDAYITKIVKYVVNEDGHIPDRVDKYLAKHVSVSNYTDLKTIYKDYCFRQFTKLSADDQVKKLSMFDRDGFVEYANMLMMDNYTRVTLDKFYATEKLRFESWDNVTSVLTEIVDIIMNYYEVPSDIATQLKQVFFANGGDRGICEVLKGKSDRFDINEVYGELMGLKDRWPNTYQRISEILDKLYEYDLRQQTLISTYMRYINTYTLFLENDKDYLMQKVNYGKALFWSMMSAQSFSFTENYDQVVIKQDVCNRLLDLREIVNVAAQGDTDKLYQSVYEYFAVKYCSFYLEMPEEKNKVISWISSNAKKYGTYVDDIDEDWIIISSYITDREAFSMFLNVCQSMSEYERSRQISGGNAEKLAVDAYGLYEKLEDESDKKYVCKILTKKIGSLCRMKDNVTSDFQVPIDLWLIVGLYTDERRVFSIFEGDNAPKIIQYRSQDVVEDSLLLDEVIIRRAADMYMKERGPLAKLVKEWCSEYQKMKKRSHGTEKGAHRDTRMPSRQNRMVQDSYGHSSYSWEDEKQTQRSHTGMRDEQTQWAHSGMSGNQTQKPYVGMSGNQTQQPYPGMGGNQTQQSYVGMSGNQTQQPYPGVSGSQAQQSYHGMGDNQAQQPYPGMGGNQTQQPYADTDSSQTQQLIWDDHTNQLQGSGVSTQQGKTRKLSLSRDKNGINESGSGEMIFDDNAYNGGVGMNSISSHSNQSGMVNNQNDKKSKGLRLPFGKKRG